MCARVWLFKISFALTYGKRSLTWLRVVPDVVVESLILDAVLESCGSVDTVGHFHYTFFLFLHFFLFLSTLTYIILTFA